MVEFALVAPIFFMMLFGVMEMGRLLWLNHELTNGTREAARYAMVHGSKASSCATQTGLETAFDDHTTGISLDDVTLTATPLCGAPDSKVVVEAVYDYDPMLGIIPGLGSFDLSAHSEVIVQH